MESNQKYDWHGKVIGGIILALATSWMVRQMNNFTGNCTPNFFPSFQIPCDSIFLILAVITLCAYYILSTISWMKYLEAKKWIETRNPQNIELKKVSHSNDLSLCNKEWRRLDIQISSVRIFVGRESIPESNIEESFILKRGECKTIPFIQFNSWNKWFTIANPHNEVNVRQFKPGNSEFDIWITYDIPGHNNGQIKKYRVKVIFDNKKGVQIGEIRNADKETFPKVIAPGN